jgi:hypothetical protein
MHLLNKVTLALATAGVLTSGIAQAELIDRGGGLLYDTVLNVTWLQDANYAKTSGSDADGLMNWTVAKNWADNLVFHDSVRNVDYSDWRLPAVKSVGSGWNENYSNDGSTDVGYNITSPHSELSYMYYVNLGLKGYYSPSGTFQPNFGIFRNGTGWGGQANVGLVKNLQSKVYWSGTATPDPADEAWVFYTFNGSQVSRYQDSAFYAWAVRSGDVSAAPEPETYAMLLAGLGLIGGVARHRKQK